MYDLKGGYNLTGVVISGSMWKTVDKVPFFSYLSVLLILGMLAFLSLNAITLCISAYQDSMFGAVVATAICWAIPLLVRIFFWRTCMDFGGLDADVSDYAGESE